MDFLDRVLMRLLRYESALETLGRMIGVTIGTMISPAWALLNNTLVPYLDIRALSSVATLVPEAIALNERLHAATHAQLAFVLIPKLFFCLFVMLGFLYLSNFIGVTTVRMLIQYYKTRPVRQ